MIDYARNAKYPALWHDCLVNYNANVQRGSYPGMWMYNLAYNRWHCEVSTLISTDVIKWKDTSKGLLRTWYQQGTAVGYGGVIKGKFPDLLQDFTVSCWIIIESEVTGSPIFTRSSPQSWLFVSAGQVLNFQERDASIRCQGVATLSLDTLYHVAVTKKGTTFTIYINGQVDATNTATPVATASTTDNDISVFDGALTSYNRSFNGWKEDFRIYNRALTQREIQLLATHPLVAFEQQPEPWYTEAATAAIMPQIIWW